MNITSYELLVGTVEEFILGYTIKRKLKQRGEYELTQSFTTRYELMKSFINTVLWILIRMDPKLLLDPDPELLLRIQQKIKEQVLFLNLGL